MKKQKHTSAKHAGTNRWPENCQRKGEYILLPKVIIRRFSQLDIEPHEFLLFLMLQVDRYEDRPPRYYWEELANWCGRNKNTVRKWGYSLKERGLLQIKQKRIASTKANKRIGVRNDRNEFDIRPFLAKVEQIQNLWDDEKQKKGRVKNESNGSEA